MSMIPCISVRQPWAWLIVNGFKDIENRGWATKRRGRVLIHAAKGLTRDEYARAAEFALFANGTVVPEFESLPRGGIVGAATIVDCVDGMFSPWFVGPYGFVLRSPQVLPFTPWKGQLGFFPVPESAVQR
jgi:hypothetical protein